MRKWLTSEAKQRFSEVVRRSSEEPQVILRRDRPVAAVISADDFEEFAAWRDQRRRRSLDQTFAEIRELAARYDYELETGERRDRDGWSGEPT